ncbi:hypothetical protein AMECASPLE_035258 [Ameca splendens]|uniref:Uncharacterized protein n=1 Tax=Ameca splendens TaxID=208324 RepID=A0ABV0ZTQ0_9TELE
MIQFTALLQVETAAAGKRDGALINRGFTSEGSFISCSLTNLFHTHKEELLWMLPLVIKSNRSSEVTSEVSGCTPQQATMAGDQCTRHNVLKSKPYEHAVVPVYFP